MILLESLSERVKGGEKKLITGNKLMEAAGPAMLPQERSVVVRVVVALKRPVSLVFQEEAFLMATIGWIRLKISETSSWVYVLVIFCWKGRLLNGVVKSCFRLTDDCN
jgi:hypothetical protein